MKNLKKFLFLATMIFVILISQRLGKSLTYDWNMEIIQNEADRNGDGLSDVISNVTPISSTYLEIYLNDTRDVEEYKWKAAICNISGFDKIGKWEYNNDTQVWSYTPCGAANCAGSLLYGNLSDYSMGINVPWCNETGNMGMLMYSSKTGDMRYRLNFTEGEKILKIFTGLNSEIMRINSGPVPNIQYLTLPDGSHPMAVVYDGVGTAYTVSFGRGSIIAINTSTMGYEEYFVRGYQTSSLQLYGLTKDANENLWFTERLAKKIGMFNTTAKTFKEFNVTGIATLGVAYNSFDGNIWFAAPTCSQSFDYKCLCKINPTSEEIACYNAGYYPTLLDFDSSGNVWFSDIQKGNLHRFNISSGDVLTVSGFDRPMGVFINGNLVYVAESSQPRLDPDYNYDKNGTIAIYNINTGEVTRVNTSIITNEGPFMPFVDSYENVWYTDLSSHVGRVGYSNGTDFVKKASLTTNDAGNINYFLAQISDKVWFSGQGSDYVGITDTSQYNVDSDSDNIKDEDDNCPNDYNPDQLNSDADGLGDVCDNCPYDADNDLDEDGVCGNVDNCPYVTNTDQLDADLDGVGDVCDNCWYVQNENQLDSDYNCLTWPYMADPKCGDVCQDSDSDGLDDIADACPLIHGRLNYQGCPVADENFVEMHVIDRPKTFCGVIGSCKLPIVGATVRVFDRNDPDFQALYTKNPDGTIYPDIFENYPSIGTCVTGSNGKCFVGEANTGDYLVIVKYVDAETEKVVYTGKPKSVSDFVDTDGDGLADLAYKDFQIIKVINIAGLVDFKAGSKTVITGSMLEVIHPQYTIWESDQTLYPFIFTSDSDWVVDVCVYVPEGYVVVEGDCTQVFVAGETKDIIFTVRETNSPEPNANTRIKTKHSGRIQNINLDIPGKRIGKDRGRHNGVPFVLAGIGLTTIGFIKKKKRV